VFLYNLFGRGGLAAFLALIFCALCVGQESKPDGVEIPLWRFDELTAPGSCRMMGRFQDKKYCDSKVVDQVVALGKDAIPILIAELTDERKTKHSVYDLWKYTTAGDIANSLLYDLFTAPDLNMTDLPELDALQHDCQKPGEACWRKFVHKKGRKFVQKQWETAWDAHKGDIYWDTEARCFRLGSSGSQSASAGHVGAPQASSARPR
jgi:hypothetical protein